MEVAEEVGTASTLVVAEQAERRMMSVADATRVMSFFMVFSFVVLRFVVDSSTVSYRVPYVQSNPNVIELIMKTSKDFEDISDFADWIRVNGDLVSTQTLGPAVETVHRVEGTDFYTLVTDYWSGKLITILEEEV